MKRYLLYLLLAASLPLMFGSCSNTKMISSWKAPEVHKQDLNKMLVLGMMGNKNRELRENLELAVIQELQTNGISATPASNVFGPNGFKGLSEEQVSQKVKKEGFTSVMIVSLIDRERERVYNEGMVYPQPVFVGYTRYYRRYMYVYDLVYSPGYYSTATNYVLQGEIYSVEGNQLLYSGQTKSYNPNTKAALAKEFSKTIVKDMAEKGLLNH
jgi:hypothetical protein